MTIQEIEAYYLDHKSTLPKTLRISQCEVVNDTRHCIELLINILKNNPKNRRFLSYYEKLLKIISLINK
jgi:hypothetical protein